MLGSDQLAGLFGGRLEGAGDRRAGLTDLVSDSRAVTPGSGFIALAGEAMDGHRFVADAAARGAALAIVAERWRPESDVPGLLLRVADTGTALRQACRRHLTELGATVIGVTGSAGKTTAKEMCAMALGPGTARTPGNLNTWTQIPLSALRLEPPVDRFVVEMGMSAPGEIADLAAFTSPRIGLLLNVGLAHVGLLGSQAAIAAAKAELLEALPADGVAVLNADDENVVAVAGRSGAPVHWFGRHGRSAAWRIEEVHHQGLAGSRATLVGPDGRVPLELGAPGEHLLLDACAAAAVAAAFGIGIAEVAERLRGFTAAEHRGRIVAGRSGSVIYDDSYNSSPASLSASLRVLATSGARRRLAIIGDMLELGDSAESSHRQAGTEAAASATELIAVGEFAGVVASAAISAGMPADAVRRAADDESAARLAADRLDADTVVMVKASHGVGLDRVVERLRA